jgi:hypothetical protein
VIKTIRQCKIRRARVIRSLGKAQLQINEADRANVKFPVIARCPMVCAE